VRVRFGAILEPDTFEELLEQLRTIGKGRGSNSWSSSDMGIREAVSSDFGGDITATILSGKAMSAQRFGDSGLLDAFSQGAEVIFYNCYVGLDPQFLASAARLFLAFSGAPSMAVRTPSNRTPWRGTTSCSLWITGCPSLDCETS